MSEPDFITVAAIKTPLPMDVFTETLAALSEAFPGAILGNSEDGPIDPTANWTPIRIPNPNKP